MLTFDEISNLPNGARFVRADLHIHSAASTEDVKPDSGMTPAAIIDDAVSRGIEIISITDHNTLEALPEAIRYASQFTDKLLFVPGVELSCNEGHLLVYFDAADYDKLKRFFYTLEIVKDAQGSRVASSMAEVIRVAYRFGGICVAAHIDTKTGFELKIPGYPASKKDLLSEPGLRGLEFREATNASWYSQDDTSPGPAASQRRQIARERASALGANNVLARLHSSDAHELIQLTGRRALTRLKLSNLSYDAFSAAFADPDGRIRIDELVPSNVPHIIGLSIGGGFLDGTSVRFAKNLNVFFGGRGTGKSTALQSIAFALGRDNSQTINQRFQAVSVYCEDANGTQYRFDRTAGRDVFGRIRKEGTVTPIAPDNFPIEYYGQGELGKVAEASLTDPSALQTFLDRHVDFEGLLEAQAELEESARDIATQLAPALAIQAKRPVLSQHLEELEARLKASEDSKIKSVAAFQNRLTAERTLKGSYEDLATQYRRGITLRNLVREPSELRSLSRVDEFSEQTKAAFEMTESIVDNVNDFLTVKTREVNEALARASSEIATALETVKSHHLLGEEKVQSYVDQLKEKGLASSLKELNELSKQKAQLIGQVGRIDAQKADFDRLEQRYQDSLKALGDTRNDIAARRTRQREELNYGFRDDQIARFDVFLVPDGHHFARDYDAFLEDRMEGSHYPSEYRMRVVHLVAPTNLAEILARGEIEALNNIEGVGRKWAPVFLERLGSPAETLLLRTFSHTPALRFKVLDRTSKLEVAFEHLSAGQKHTIMLTIALLAGSRYPLVIDQPEDDLDNEFIAERLVKTLRKVKEFRQVVLVTHNANIAVLGDSEQLLGMHQAEQGGGRIASRGSIDDQVTRVAVTNSLEGGEEAFRRRAVVYGL